MLNGYKILVGQDAMDPYSIRLAARQPAMVSAAATPPLTF